jgi:hypothetical protein
MTTPDAILSPPRLIGTDAVGACLGIQQAWVARLVRTDDPRLKPGYLGKIRGRHVWNAHELFSSMYSTPHALWEEIERARLGGRTDAVCHCGKPVLFLGLCPNHVRRLMSGFQGAQRSSLAAIQLLAMCRWVVDRNQHIEPGIDPWSGVCVTPGCDNRTDVPVGRVSPLCRECARRLFA